MASNEGAEAFRIGRARATRETPKAIYVSTEAGSVLGARSFWLPKSAVHDDSEVFDAGENAEGELVVQRWLARKEGWETE